MEDLTYPDAFSSFPFSTDSLLSPTTPSPPKKKWNTKQRCREGRKEWCAFILVFLGVRRDALLTGQTISILLFPPPFFGSPSLNGRIRARIKSFLIFRFIAGLSPWVDDPGVSLPSCDDSFPDPTLFRFYQDGR